MMEEKMRPQWRLYLRALVLMSGLLAVPAVAQDLGPLVVGQTYTPIDYPGACGTIATAINSVGTIVGDFGFSCKTPEVIHGYILSQGAFTRIDYPGATSTRPLGINGSGDIVGWYRNSKGGKDRGFLFSGGVFTPIDFPGASQTHAISIDSVGNIFGSYCIGGNSCYPIKALHGFIFSGGVFTTIDFPGALLTEVWGQDSAGQIAGRYQDANGLFHAFLLSNGSFSSIDFPGAAETAPGWYAFTGGINTNGDIATTYCTAEPCANLSSSTHGFLLIGDVYTTIDFPAAIATAAFALNSSDTVVGPYMDASGKFHGFLYTP
jgi:uncharacterized membrane protein